VSTSGRAPQEGSGQDGRNEAERQHGVCFLVVAGLICGCVSVRKLCLTQDFLCLFHAPDEEIPHHSPVAVFQVMAVIQEQARKVLEA
jgi:hypothetical protein